METSELLKKVRKIEIKTKGLSANILSGQYHSAFKGRGMSFSEVRAYNYGDDVRNIDWNVTARAGVPYVKMFEEERELTMMLLVDMSRSAFFGTATQFKNELMTEISAALAFSAISNNDKVGMIFFTNTVEKFIPPKKGRSHILRIIRELLDFEPSGKGTNIGKGLEYLNNIIKKRSICFILSDFMSRDYTDALRIAARRHDIVGVHVVDPREEELPPVGLMRAVDAETGAGIWIDTDDQMIRRRYSEWYKDNLNFFKTTFARSGADVMNVRTNEPYVNALMRFFQKRV